MAEGASQLKSWTLNPSMASNVCTSVGGRVDMVCEGVAWEKQRTLAPVWRMVGQDMDH